VEEGGGTERYFQRERERERERRVRAVSLSDGTAGDFTHMAKQPRPDRTEG